MLEVNCTLRSAILFVTSSFFLFLKTNEKNINASQLTRYIKRIFLLYLTYFILNIVWIIHARIGFSNLLSLKAWLTFIKNAIFTSTFTGSWYLVSCIFSAFIVYVLSQKLSTLKIIFITAPIYIFCILTSAYSGLLSTNFLYKLIFYFASPQNSIICGIFFFAIGKYIAEKYRNNSNKSNPKIYFVLSIVFLALYYFEITILDYFKILGGTDASFMLIPLSYTLVTACVNCKCNIKGAVLMRKASTIIYCSQASVMLVARFISTKILGITHSFLIFSLAIVLMFIFVFLVLFLQKNKSIKLVNYLT